MARRHLESSLLASRPVLPASTSIALFITSSEFPAKLRPSRTARSTVQSQLAYGL
jgi:hypothetical protein